MAELPSTPILVESRAWRNGLVGATAKLEKTDYPGIYRRYNRYVVRVFAGKKPVHVGTVDSLKDARDLQAQHRTTVQERVDQGKAPTPADKTSFAAYAQDWLKRKEATMKVSSLRSTTAVVTATLIPVFGAKPLKQLTTSTIEDGFTTLKRKNGTAFSPKSLRNIAQILREILSDAVRRDSLATVPPFTLPIRREDGTPKPLTIPDPSVMAQVIASMPSPYQEAATLAACTGLRQGELLALRWDAITPQGILVTVSRDQLGSETTPKSRAGTRLVPLPPSVVAFLTAYQKRQTPPSPFLFPVSHIGSYKKKGTTEDIRNPDRLPVIDDAKLRKVFTAACQKVGVTARFHDLRHVFASQVIATGGHASLPLLAACLGHSTPAFTLKQYTHLFHDTAPTFMEGVATAYSSLLPETPPYQQEGGGVSAKRKGVRRKGVTEVA